MLKKSIIALFLIGLFGSFVNAQVDPMNLPKLTQYVTDFSNTLTTSQLADLNARAQSYDQQTSNQIVAVLFPNRNRNELIDIGMNVFDANKIWQAGKNNGLLLLISTEEKKIRIIVWYGLEDKIPDLLASRFIEENIRPLVNSGDFAGAIRMFYDRSINAIASDEAATVVDTTQSNTSKSQPLDWIGIVWILLWAWLFSLFAFLFHLRRWSLSSFLRMKIWQWAIFIGVFILLLVLASVVSIFFLFVFLGFLLSLFNGRGGFGLWWGGWFGWWGGWFWWWGWGSGWGGAGD